MYGNKVFIKVVVFFDIGRFRDKFKINIELDKDEDVLVVFEEEEDK